MSNRVSDGWFTKTIGDIGPFFNGLNGKTSKDFGQGEPFLTYLQVFNKTLSVREQAGLVSVDEDEKQEKVQYGDILFTTSSETPDEVGMAAVFLEKDWSPYLNSFCFGLRPKEGFPLSPEFANHFFRGGKFRKDMRPLAQGSTRFNLSKENLKKLSVTLPPPLEQKKIASILTSVDEVIENTQKQIDKLQDLKKATMNELLTKGIGHTEFKDSELGRIPKSWQVKDIANSNIQVLDGDRGSEYPKEYDFKQSGYCLFLSAKNVTRSGFKFDETVFISKDKDQKLQKGRLKRNDIVITTRGTVGNIAFFDESVVFDVIRINSGMAIIRNDDEHLQTDFLYLILSSELVTLQLESLTFGSAQPQLTIGTLNELKILIPTTVDEQKKISNIISSINQLIEVTTKKLHQTQSLKKSLMQDLLTGKVRVKVN